MSTDRKNDFKDHLETRLHAKNHAAKSSLQSFLNLMSGSKTADATIK